MSDSEVPQKGTLEYIKYKRRLYNKKYQEKVKQKLEQVESQSIKEETDSNADFFFQQKMKKQPNQQPQKEQQIVLKMPETTISSQIKNQLIMGALAFIPMLFTSLSKIYLKKSETKSTTQSTNQQPDYSQTNQPLNFW